MVQAEWVMGVRALVIWRVLSLLVVAGGVLVVVVGASGGLVAVTIATVRWPSVGGAGRG